MKAMLSKEVGGPETLVLKDMPTPEPGKKQVRIRVHAAGVNFPDTLIIRDLYQMKPPRPFAPGGEIAGEIEAVGEGVEGLGGWRPRAGHDRLRRFRHPCGRRCGPRHQNPRCNAL